MKPLWQPVNPKAPLLITDSPTRNSILRRTKILLECRNDRNAQAHQLAFCLNNPIYFINTFAITYDPRLAEQNKPAKIPFDLFPKQQQLITFLEDRLKAGEEGLVEKSRGVGWTWVAAAFAVHHWLFIPGFLTSFGSRKEELVDTIGDPKSIFDKIRTIIYALPKWMLPPSYDRKRHDNHCRIVNPYNGNTITGEAGSQMGRGGRSSLYLLDEAAFLEHDESVAAAVLDNANCRIWASTVNPENPLGTIFAKKRHDGSLAPNQIFTFEWRDNPTRTDEWAKKKKQELKSTPHIWYSEYEIDYSASAEGICIPAAWIKSALTLRDHIDPTFDYLGIGGLDIGAGVAESVFIARFGPWVLPPQAWTQPDTTNTAYQALEAANNTNIQTLNFDTIGVGKGVLSTLTHEQHRPRAEGETRSRLTINPVNVGSPPSWQYKWPDGKTARQKFQNLKAEIWWLMRERFRCSAEHLASITNEEIPGIEPQPHSLDDLLIFAEPPQHYRQLIVQLSIPKRTFNNNGKIVLESKQQLQSRGIASPDQAEALSLTFTPHGTSPSIDAANPIVLQNRSPSPYPELNPPPVPRITGGRPPTVRTGTRFDNDFARDW